MRADTRVPWVHLQDENLITAAAAWKILRFHTHRDGDSTTVHNYVEAFVQYYLRTGTCTYTPLRVTLQTMKNNG